MAGLVRPFVGHPPLTLLRTAPIDELHRCALAFRGAERQWLLLPWISAPFAWMLVRRVAGGTSGRDLNPMLERSGQLVVMFGILLALGLWLARPR